MDRHGLSALSHLRSKPVGRVRRRVRDLRTSNGAYGGVEVEVEEGGGGGGGLPTKTPLDLSHSESQRLAVDALLQGGGGRRGGLPGAAGGGGREESDPVDGEENGCDDDEEEEEEEEEVSRQVGGARPSLSLSHFLSQGSEESLDDESQAPEPCSSPPGAHNELDFLYNKHYYYARSRATPSSGTLARVELFLQSGSREGSMKDLIRETIRNTQTALVIVVETFSDVELLCDILEACTKRSVCVYLLLDRLNLQQFLDMCVELNVDGKHFPRLSVRSVDGPGYCTKTGRRLPGQNTETFIISDWTLVLTGSYRYSRAGALCCCGIDTVDRIFIVLLAGGRSVTSFRREFRRLYLRSRPVAPRFHAASASIPPTGYASRLGLSQKNPCDLALESMLKRRRRGADGNKDPAAGETETQTDSMEPVHVALSKLEVEHNRAEAYVMSLEQISQPGQTGQAEPPSQWRTEFPQYAYLPLSDAGAAERQQQQQQQRWRGGAPQAHATPNSTLSHAYKQNGGNDTQLACGQQTTAAAAVAGGFVYQQYRNSRTAMEYGTTASNLETLRRVQRSESQKANGSRPATESRPLSRTQSLLQKTHQVQGAAQGLLYNHAQSQRKWLGLAQLSPQGGGGGGGGGGGACRTQSPNKLPWPGAGAAPRDVKSFSPDPRTDLKSQAKPQQLQESGYSAGVPLRCGTKATPQDPQSYASQQLGQSQRLYWISQLHARPLVSGATGNGMAGGGRRTVGELSQRDNGKSGACGTKSHGPGNGVPGRPAVLHRGATLNARLKENESRGHQRP
ncbi:LOW QUALITY PROTEIN: hypothetical protein CRUP_037355 [Coryphaenoides rupestris]|nr:LOW QUALITY PROTEIN: hypothetical protein CRUP_037355 [Coryphaenoides rupestris]